MAMRSLIPILLCAARADGQGTPKVVAATDGSLELQPGVPTAGVWIKSTSGQRTVNLMNLSAALNEIRTGASTQVGTMSTNIGAAIAAVNRTMTTTNAAMSNQLTLAQGQIANLTRSLNNSMSQLVDAEASITAAQLLVETQATSIRELNLSVRRLNCSLQNLVHNGTHCVRGPNSQASPAASCRELNSIGSPSGIYWVSTPTGAIQVYCDNVHLGGGWTLILKIANETQAEGPTPVWGYTSQNWNTAGSLANTASNMNLQPGDFKSMAYGSVAFSEMHFVLARGPFRPMFRYSFQGATLPNALSVFTGNELSAGLPGRSTWIQWMAPYFSGYRWANQANCNHAAFNVVGPSYACRLGIVMNNEANCLTPDSAIGFGCYCGTNSDPSERVGAGGFSWGARGTRRIGVNGWILVR